MSQLTDMIPRVAPEYHQLLVKTASEIQQDPYKDDILREMNAIIKKAEALVGHEKTAASPMEDMLSGTGTTDRLKKSLKPRIGKSLGNWKGIVKGTAAAFGVMTAGGIALALAGDLYESAKRGLTRGRDYRNMIEANPDLGKPGVSAKAKTSFSTLHKFNPDFAGDPNVAGSFVRYSIEYPGTEISQVKDLVQARSNMQKPKELPSMGSAPSSILYN